MARRRLFSRVTAVAVGVLLCAGLLAATVERRDTTVRVTGMRRARWCPQDCSWCAGAAFGRSQPQQQASSKAPSRDFMMGRMVVSGGW